MPALLGPDTVCAGETIDLTLEVNTACLCPMPGCPCGCSSMTCAAYRDDVFIGNFCDISEIAAADVSYRVVVSCDGPVIGMPAVKLISRSVGFSPS